MIATAGARGFTLLEALVGSAISLVVVGLSCRLAADAQSAWRSSAARVDLHQRARVAADLVPRLFREAGAGPLSGPARAAGASGVVLMRGLPPVLPRRIGRRGGDAVDVFRPDAVSVVRAVAESEHGVLLVGTPAGATVLELAPRTGCLLPACGFEAGTAAMLLDASGRFDIFTVTSVAGMVLTVRHHGPNPSSAYAAGTAVVAVDFTSLALDPASRTLRAYDGDASDLPLLDDVVGMEVRYWGEPEPPAWPRPPGGEENCLYAADGSYRAALMPALGPAGRLVELTAALLTDGPWCGSGDTQFDADLLRVRLVRVRLRFQASDAAVRGRGAGFVHPGAATRAALLVPDRTVSIDVTPRHMRSE